MGALDQAVDLLKQFEGFRANAYQDQGGVWTCGFGSTGPRVGPSTTVTEAEAEGMLRHTLEALAHVLDDLVKVPLTENQRCALLSFTYNAGTSALARSTLLVKLNEGDDAGAADEFLKWTYVKGKPNVGLANRRHAERALFLKA